MVNDVSGPATAPLRVIALRSLSEIAPHAEAIDALNLVSRRPSPFATFGFLRAYLEHDEFPLPGDQVLFLAAFRGDALAGYLPLRSTVRRAFGLPYREIELFVTRDADRPHLVARAEDEPACAAAFYRHLAARERWSAIDLAFQDEASALWPVAGLRWPWYRTRRYPDMENTTVPTPYASLAEFYRTLPSNFRSTVSRMSRRLLAAGQVETVSCHATGARRPLLDLFVDVEQRSWKAIPNVGLARSAARLDFFRALAEADQPLALSYDFVLLDGVPISAMMSASFDGRWYALETGYDTAYADLSPGYLTWLLAFRHGIAQGLGSYNLQTGFSYYKSRWRGEVTPTFIAQVHRVPSLPWLKGRLGDLRRMIVRRAGKQAHNEVKREADRQGQAEPGAPRPDRTGAAALAARTLAALAAGGVSFERLSGPALLAALPFQPDAGKQKPGRPQRRPQVPV
ncbi:MAG: GNAT family N-acetyltransferase [Anaeromyxobacter sp.]